MKRSASRFIVLIMAIGLAGCGPSDSDVRRAVGGDPGDVFDISCTEAIGKPGYTCTYTFRNKAFVLTRRFVKSSDGNWNIAFD